MRFSKGRALTVIGLSFMLTGCGDGWETVEYTGKVPYTMERTAGSGVMYVRAKMMPEKQLKLADDLEKDLVGSKFKGYSGKAKANKPDEQAANDVQPLAGGLEEQAVAIQQTEPAAGDAAAPAPEQTSSLTSEQVMMQRLLKDNPEVQSEIFPERGERQIVASAIEPAAGIEDMSASESAMLEPPALTGGASADEIEDMRSGYISQEDISVPKAQPLKPLSKGERQLNEIYDDGSYQTQD